MNQKRVVVVLVILLAVIVVAKVNNSANSDTWRISGDGEFTPQGLVLRGSSQAFADYDDYSPEKLTARIEPGSEGTYTVTFKNDYRPVIRVAATPEQVSVNGQEIDAEPPFNVVLTLDWDNNEIDTVAIGEGKGDVGPIDLLKEADELDRTRVYQRSGATRGLYRIVKPGN